MAHELIAGTVGGERGKAIESGSRSSRPLREETSWSSWTSAAVRTGFLPYARFAGCTWDPQAQDSHHSAVGNDSLPSKRPPNLHGCGSYSLMSGESEN